MTKSIINIKGMSCMSCQTRIQNELEGLKGVKSVNVSYEKANAEIEFVDIIISLDEIESSISGLGYEIIKKQDDTSKSNKKLQNIKSKPKNNNIGIIIGLLAIFIGGYFILENTIGFNYIPTVTQSMGYGILFVVGLFTSVHCIAMCGGINLSQCISKDADNSKNITKKLKPSILYNLGRVISYTIIGGLVGALGSIFNFSTTAKSFVAIAAGIFMLLMGLNMLNVFPSLRKLVPKLPKALSKKVKGAKQGRGPLIVGLLNGFMPCGPLQTMQIYALGTGSFLTGALSMFMFSLGTVPLMFAFGALSSILSSKFTKKLMIVSAVLVMGLGIIMAGRGFTQAGISLRLPTNQANNNDTQSTVIKAENNTDTNSNTDGTIQYVTTQMSTRGYDPFVVKAGIPVVWTLMVEDGDLTGCNNAISIPAYGIQRKLAVGENIIKFMPPDEDTNIVFTCWMAMIRSNISVVKD